MYEECPHGMPYDRRCVHCERGEPESMSMTTDLKKLAVKRYVYTSEQMLDEALAHAENTRQRWVRYSDYTLLQQEVETLREALEIYGEHKVNCKADRRIGDCDCGLAEALQHTGEDGETWEPETKSPYEL